MKSKIFENCWKFWNFMKILKSYENFWNFWNFEHSILNFFFLIYQPAWQNSKFLIFFLILEFF